MINLLMAWFKSKGIDLFNNNKYTVVIFLSFFSSSLVFSLEPEDLLVSDALSRNDLLESVFLCDFNKRACPFKGDDIIKLLSDR